MVLVGGVSLLKTPEWGWGRLTLRQWPFRKILPPNNFCFFIAYVYPGLAYQGCAIRHRAVGVSSKT
jgi:hypothetical protein